MCAPRWQDEVANGVAGRCSVRIGSRWSKQSSTNRARREDIGGTSVHTPSPQLSSRRGQPLGARQQGGFCPDRPAHFRLC